MRGVSLGIILVIFTQVLLVYYGLKYIRQNRLLTSHGDRPNETEPLVDKQEKQSKESTLPFPQPIVDFLKRRKQEDNGHSIDLLNLLLHRMFITWRSSDKFRTLWGQKMSRKINLKLKDNSYITLLNIKDLILGEYPPIIKNVKSTILDDLALVSFFN
jgi:hypothetical protein